MKGYSYGFMIVLQFFSTLPIKREIPMTSNYLERAVRMFPVFGLFLGVVYAGSAYVLLQYTPFSPLAVTFGLWLFPIVLTGGIHLDGWMDSSDAFFFLPGSEQTTRNSAGPANRSVWCIKRYRLTECKVSVYL